MAEYLIQGKTLNSLADKIRTLSGTENLLGTVAMTEKIDEANAEISEQMDLIAQITDALTNKSIPSEECTLQFTGLSYYWIVYQDLDGVHYSEDFSKSITIKKNSVITIAADYQSFTYGGVEQISQNWINDRYVQCYHCTDDCQIDIDSKIM